MKSIITKITMSIIVAVIGVLMVVNYVRIPFESKEIRNDYSYFNRMNEYEEFFGVYLHEDDDEPMLISKDMITDCYWYKGDRYVEFNATDIMTVTAKLMPSKKTGNLFYTAIDHKYNW